MERMSDIYESFSRDFGVILQWTNWIVDSGATYHMTPQFSDFITGLLEDTDKYIEVSDGYYITAEKYDKFK